MAKNIKDIVEEGFAKLASLADRRKEILQRCELVANAASGAPLAAAEQKVRAAESMYVEEINTQVEHLLSELQQTLAQVAENNQFYQGGVRDKLTMHVGGALTELSQTEDYLHTVSSVQLDSQFAQTDKEIKSYKDDISNESSKMIAELDAECRQNTVELKQTQAEIAGQLTHNQNELNGLIGETCNSIIQNAEKKRKKVSEKLQKLAKGQSDELGKAQRGTEELVEAAAVKSKERMQESCSNAEDELKKKSEIVLNNVLSDMQSVSKDALAQLEDSYDYSRQELSEKLTSLLDLTKKLLQQEQQSLSEMDGGMRNQADALCVELRTGGSDVDGTGIGPRNPIEEAFGTLNDDLNDISDELNRRIKVLLKDQRETMTNFCNSAEKSLLDLFADFMTQMKDNIKVQDQLCIQKEEELLRKLDKLEKQINDTRSQINGGGGAGR